MWNTIYFLIILVLLSVLAWPHFKSDGALRREAIPVEAWCRVAVEAPELSRLDAIYRRRAAALSDDFETTRSNVGATFRHSFKSSPAGDR
ncbi:MAG: hypothetical protein AB7F32_03140 [Victivallaceae bacterium]